MGCSVYDILDGYEGEIGNNNKRDTAVYDGKEMRQLVTSPSGLENSFACSRSDAGNEYQDICKNVILFALLAVIMSVVFPPSSPFLLPGIKELTKSVEKMKEGVFGERIEDGGRDEIGILAEVFSDLRYELYGEASHQGYL